MRKIHAGIVGVGSAVFDLVDNRTVSKWRGVTKTPAQIEKSTGIVTRSIAKPGETTSMLAERAARSAIIDAGRDPTDIDYIIVATNTPDYLVPQVASIIQAKLGIKCRAADVKAGCAGFAGALEMAEALIATGRYRNVLVIGVDLLSHITDRRTSTAMLLGDGAGAVVVSAVSKRYGFAAFTGGSDGSQLDKLWIPEGGTAQPITASGIRSGQNMLQMDGYEVYSFGIKTIDACVRELAEQLGVGLDQIDWVVCHQANWKMIAKAADALGMSIERFAKDLDEHGNTSNGSIGLALDKYVGTRQIKRGQLVIMIGFGAGLVWYACACRWAYNRPSARTLRKRASAA
jgi:3-oxoacyl-[acyl-carrier-protein] synthase-3